MIRPRRGGPGLIGTAARTAVIAGTATRVSGNVAASQQAKAQQRVPVQQPPQPTVVVAAPAPPAEDTIAQLERLAALHQQGALTEAEFTAAKANTTARRWRLCSLPVPPSTLRKPAVSGSAKLRRWWAV